MTTIITKNGSGAPTAGQLSQGELAVDLTNKELYTKDSGGNVIKVGAQGGSTGTFTDLTATSSFTSPGIDDNATSTAITIDSSENVGINVIAPSRKLDVLGTSGAVTTRIGNSGSTANYMELGGTDGSTRFGHGGGGSFSLLTGGDSAYAGEAVAMTVSANGNVGIGGAPISGARQLMVKGATDTRVDIRSGSDTNLGAIDFSDTSNTARGQVVYDHNDDSMQFKTLSSERMRIDSSGNVGIGTQTPARKLHVSGADEELLRVEGASAQLRLSTEADNTFDFDNVVTGGELSFSTVGSERMRIDASGNVGIGAAAPAQLLHLKDNDPALRLEDDEGGAARTYDVGSVGGSFVVKNVSQATQPLTILDSGNVGIGTASPSEKLAVVGSGAATSAYIYDGTGSTAARLTADGDNIDLSARGSASSNLTFTTGAGAGSEAVRIDSSGNLLVGRTASGGGADDGHTLYGTGAIYSSLGGTASTNQYRFYRNGSIVGSINTSGTGTSYVETSDERVKENIVDAPAGNIDDIKVRSFDFKNGSGHVTYGFIAQELHEVAPQAVAVGETDEDMWGVDYSKLVPMLVKEIQDLKAEVAALKGA